MKNTKKRSKDKTRSPKSIAFKTVTQAIVDCFDKDFIVDFDLDNDEKEEVINKACAHAITLVQKKSREELVEMMCDHVTDNFDNLLEEARDEAAKEGVIDEDMYNEAKRDALFELKD